MPTEKKPSTALTKPGSAEERLADRLLAEAHTPTERAVAFQALTAYRQSKMIRECASAVASLSWGAELSPYARAAIARYALATGTDPVRHWLVLGGKLYDTSALWEDLATSQPDYAGHDFEHINDDPRLDENERALRRQLRAQYNVPEDVKGACIVRIYKAGLDRAFIGVNHAGHFKTTLARTGKEGTKLDPIGEENPGKTAQTRAFRRAAKMAWPTPIMRDVGTDEGVSLESLQGPVTEAIEQGQEAVRKAATDRPLPPAGATLGGLPDGAYGFESAEDQLALEEDADLTEP